MTAVYAFASPANKIGFIAADNLDASTGGKTDKITMCSGRFAIAVFGKSIPSRALQAIAAFEEYDNVISPTNLNDVLTQTWELTKLLCDRHYSEKQAQKERGEVLDFDWMQFEHSSATLVILDCRTYTIYEVEQKRLFPPDKIDQLAEVRPKETDILHLSSLADIAARRSCETASFDDVEQVLSFVAKRIRKDQSVVPIIGDPGTIVIVCDGKITKHTTFNGPKDYIETCLEQMG